MTFSRPRLGDTPPYFLTLASPPPDVTLRDRLAVGLAAWTTATLWAVTAWLDSVGPDGLAASVTAAVPAGPVVSFAVPVTVVAGVVARAVLSVVDDPAEQLRAGVVSRVTRGVSGGVAGVGVGLSVVAEGEPVVFGVSLVAVLVPESVTAASLVFRLVSGGVVGWVAAFAVAFHADRVAVARARAATPPSRRVTFDARRRRPPARGRVGAVVTLVAAAGLFAGEMVSSDGTLGFLLPAACVVSQAPLLVRGRSAWCYEVTADRLVTPLGSVTWTAVENYRVTPTAVELEGADHPVTQVALDRESIDDETVTAALDRHLTRPGSDESE